MDFLSAIFLTAGGTGGHIFPAEALAREFIRRGYKNIYLITDIRFAKYVEKIEGIKVVCVKSGRSAAGVIGKLKCIYGITVGFLQSVGLILKHKPAAIIGFGGYPSFPPMLAGVMCGRCTIIHEQNAFAGVVNRFLAKFVTMVAASHLSTVGIAGAVVTGNPVRPQIRAIRQQKYPDLTMESGINILVTGGSQGAALFSRIIPEAIAKLPADLKSRITITQQVHEGDINSVKQKYDGMGIVSNLQPFFSNMNELLANAHLLICRAGASTIAELFAAGRPAILIPFAAAKDDHQTVNARSVVDSRAGWMIAEKDLTADALKQKLSEILNNPELLKTTAEKAFALGEVDAAALLAERILAI